MQNLLLTTIVVFFLSLNVHSQTNCANIILDVSQTNFCSNSFAGAVNINALVDGLTPGVGTSDFSGDGVTQIDDATAIFDPVSTGEGMFETIFTYTDPNTGCVSMDTVEFTVSDVPIPLITADSLQICEGELVTITHTGPAPSGTEIWNIAGADFDNLTPTIRELAWDNAGMYTVSLTYTVPGCNPETSQLIIEVSQAATIPIITCESSGSDFIQFGWNDQTNFMYEVFIDGQSQGEQSESFFRVENLLDGQQVEIRVVVLDSACGNQENSITCVSSPCNVVWNNLNITETEFCSPDDFPLEISISAFDPFDPSNVIDAVWQNPEFNGNFFTPIPGQQDYRLVGRYINGTCMRDTIFNITVFETPQFILTADADVICEGSSIVFSPDIPITNGEVLMWDVAGSGFTEVNSGDDFIEFEFTDIGPQTVTLQIDNNGCLSDIVPIIIEVEPELIAPDIQCGASTITTAEFVWGDVDGADMYDISVNGDFVTTQAGTSFTVENLLSETMVDITVTAISAGACDDVMMSFTCMSEPCPTEIFDFDLDPTDIICLDANANIITITATPTTLAGTGSGTWSTTAPQNFIDADGNINPSLAIEGTFELIYDYQEDVCTFSPTTMITFIDPPTVNILEVLNPECQEDTEGTIEVEAVGGLAPYSYSLDGGTAQTNGLFTNVGIGAHEVQVTDDNGCVSTTLNVSIAPPIVPTARIIGNSVIFENTDGVYELDFNGTLDPVDIVNILWTNNGEVVIDSPGGFMYTYNTAIEDAELEAVITYRGENGGECEITTAIFEVDVRQFQSFYIPNVINPEFAADAINSEWRIFVVGDEVFPQSIKVFNRWGNLVHEVEWNFDENNRPPVGVGGLFVWDGLTGEDGEEIEAGVYAYAFEVIKEGNLQIVAGSLTIIR